MAIDEHIEMLLRGVEAWNSWRTKFPEIIPDLSNCTLKGIHLHFAANLRKAYLSKSDLSGAQLDGALLQDASLVSATLINADLRKAKLIRADLRGANLTKCNLHRANISNSDFRGANLTDARLDIKRAANTRFQNAILKDAYFAEDDRFVEFDISPLELAWSNGLDQINPLSGFWLNDYLEKVFEYAHAKDTMDAKYYKAYLDESLDRIGALQSLYREQDFSTAIVETIRSVDAELVAYLRRHPNAIHSLHWRAFEELVAELLSGFGWEVQLTSPTKDNGYDIFGIYRDDSGVQNAWIIECKKFNIDRPVGIEIARSLYGVKNDLRVGGAMLATTSHFTKGVHKFKASRYDFELRDYGGILDWINTYRPNPAGSLLLKNNRITLLN